MKYEYKRVVYDFAQPNQKGKTQTKDQWIASQLKKNVFGETSVTEDERRIALGDVWDKLSAEKTAKETPVAEPIKEVKADNKGGK